ncbi:MAG: metallophosphoesterase family protein [Candidatus Electrothrix aestuarii]|uniref:Metallophosphoesterase family protein n=1 Tax=Candidatus Electrothrix aestuarii TaxID=3062594 RepID=A0AAU8M0S6_9BACT|nr:metallophosphoesterase family protein [Candidatus Electrothrix aestuarii]
MTALTKTCVIGDIHGCLNSLHNLLSMIENEADTFVFLGDYIDRGSESKEVVETILEFKKKHRNVITLLGNHEIMLINYLRGYDDGTFLRAGGKETLLSYGIKPKIKPDKAAKLFPEEHMNFFKELPLLWENEHAIYAHAGIEPGVHLSRQVSSYCLWARDEFIRTPYKFTKPVVFGHTVFREPLVQENKIGIDTGAVYGGNLTALILPEKRFLSVGGEKTKFSPRLT